MKYFTKIHFRDGKLIEKLLGEALQVQVLTLMLLNLYQNCKCYHSFSEILIFTGILNIVIIIMSYGMICFYMGSRWRNSLTNLLFMAFLS